MFAPGYVQPLAHREPIKQELEVRPKNDPYVKALSNPPGQGGLPVHWQRDRDYAAHYVFSEEDPYSRTASNTAMPSAHKWVPPIDIDETENETVIHMELPGIYKNMIDISVDKNAGILLVRGERGRAAQRDRSKEYRHSERQYGPFERAITLPKGLTLDQIHCLLDHGVLKISFPKLKSSTGQQETRSAPGPVTQS